MVALGTGRLDLGSSANWMRISGRVLVFLLAGVVANPIALGRGTGGARSTDARSIGPGMTNAGYTQVSAAFRAITGTGVAPADRDRLFKLLFTTKARGMGMGLSICCSITENHDGGIRASPGLQGGAIFEFELPANGREA
jgi:signal transduction histidine kinase